MLFTSTETAVMIEQRNEKESSIRLYAYILLGPHLMTGPIKSIEQYRHVIDALASFGIIDARAHAHLWKRRPKYLLSESQTERRNALKKHRPLHQLLRHISAQVKHHRPRWYSFSPEATMSSTFEDDVADTVLPAPEVKGKPSSLIVSLKKHTEEVSGRFQYHIEFRVKNSEILLTTHLGTTEDMRHVILNVSLSEIISLSKRIDLIFELSRLEDMFCPLPAHTYTRMRGLSCYTFAYATSCQRIDARSQPRLCSHALFLSALRAHALFQFDVHRSIGG